MTLNQVLDRIKRIALSHKQVRNYSKGLITDFLNDQKTKYPSVFLQDNGGSIDPLRHSATFSFRMFIVDLVHVSEEQKVNEQDVHSDMIAICMDIITMLNDPNYNDWVISGTNNRQLLVEQDGDMYAGCAIDFSVRVVFEQDRCVIPTDVYHIPNDEEMNVFDVTYIATGSEGTTLTTSGDAPHIPVINGKKILLVTRERNQLFRASSSPDPAEFTWNDSVIILGTATNPEERFLILYRNY